MRVGLKNWILCLWRLEKTELCDCGAGKDWLCHWEAGKNWLCECGAGKVWTLWLGAEKTELCDWMQEKLKPVVVGAGKDWTLWMGGRKRLNSVNVDCGAGKDWTLDSWNEPQKEIYRVLTCTGHRKKGANIWCTYEQFIRVALVN